MAITFTKKRSTLWLDLLWSLSLLCLALASALRGQTPTPTLSVTSRLVVLDVVVTDAQGKPVSGLTRDDFTLLQDNQPQRIRNFEGWNDRPAAAVVPTVDRYGRETWGDGVARTIFVLDELNTPFEEKSFAADNLRRYLASQPARLRQPSTLIAITCTGLNTLTPYTRGRDVLLRGLAARPPALPAHGSDLELAASTFAMLRQIAMASEGLHAHTNLVWIGRGFPTLDPTDFTGPDSAVLKKAIEDTVNLLLAARITVYEINPITTEARTEMGNLDVAMGAGAGLSSHFVTTPGADLLDEQFSFNRFVSATGGSLYFGRNDLDHFLADSEVRGSDFYTLAYTPPGGMDESLYHGITVQMRDPSFHATAKQGFYSLERTPTETNFKDLGFDLKLAATGALTYSGIGVRITAIHPGHTRGKLEVSFEIADSTLLWTPRDAGGDTAAVTVLVVGLDKDRRIQSSFAANLTLAVKDPTEVAGGRVQATREVAINARTRSIRLVIRDASGKIGTADAMLAAITSGAK